MPPATILSWWRGHPAGWWNPADYNVASICVPIATHVPRPGSRGASSAASRRSRWCSSATARPPRAHSTRANLAAVMQAPLVLVCNNNHWAISTPLEAQTAAETLADKAVGYGMPGVRVDGTDVLAVHEAARAVERARSGGGPTFIEAVTYRVAPHATADDPSAYIDRERVEDERRRECVRPLRRLSARAGILSDDLAAGIRARRWS